MKKIVSICFLILFSITTNAQKNYVKTGEKYKTVQIYPRSGGVFKARNLELLSDSMIQFNRIEPSSKETMDVSKVNFISVKKGNRALQYGLYGAGIGILFDLYVELRVAQNDLSYSLYTADDSLPVAVGSILGFGAVGALIGSGFIKWQNLYIQPRSTAFRYYFRPDIYNGYCGIHFACNF